MTEGPYRNVRLTVETAERLKKLGSKGDTYEDIILKLLNPGKEE